MIRILILSARYTPDADGVATHVANLAEGLARLGRNKIEFAYVLTGRDPKKEDNGPHTQTGRRLIVQKLPRRQVSNYDHQTVPMQDVLGALIEQGTWGATKPNIIHAHDYQSVLVGLAVKSWLEFRPRLILTMHRAASERPRGEDPEDAKEAYLRMLTKGLLDHIVVPSEASQKALLQYANIDASQTSVIKHGINARHYSSYADDPMEIRKLRCKKGTCLVLCPIRDDPHKDPEVFLRAINRIADLSPSRRFLFLITSELTKLDESFIQLDKAKLPNNARFKAKQFEFAQMPTLYRRAAVCVVPSLSESFGQTVLEAFVYRCPVVAAHSGALPEIIRHKKNGLLFMKHDHESLAQNVFKVLANEKLRKTLVDNALRDVKEIFSQDKMIQSYFKLYKSILAG